MLSIGSFYEAFMKKQELKNLEFELVYLALLTRAGLKPLSRWEKTLSPEQVSILESIDLNVAHVSRRLENGSICTESIFSKSEGSIDLYLSAFEGKPLRKTDTTQRLEGMLFGFPSCCIEHFIKYGYTPNHLSQDDQKLLFHWACPNCELTRNLLPLYRQTFESCRHLQMSWRNESDRSLLKSTCAAVTALSVLVAGIGMLVPSSVQGASEFIDPHHLTLPTGTDLDQDFLNDSYEPMCGTEPDNADTDGDTELDGIQIATELAEALDTLPHSPQNDQTYITDHEMYGLETCSICQETVNMGYAVITNPVEQLSIQVPYISLHHFLQHGSFAYEGDVHGKDYVNAALLYAIVFGNGQSHLFPVESDTDADGLPDDEERFWGNDPDQPDTDADGVRDGRQLAQRYAAEIDSLPRSETEDSAYVIEHKARGVVLCPCCGQCFNMGYMELIHPQRKDTLQLSFLQHHFLHCGSFSVPGDPDSLFTPHRLYELLSERTDLHQLEVIPDTDGDGLTDEEENLMDQNAYNPDEDRNGIPDGADLAMQLAAQVNALPDSFTQSSAFVTHYQVYGMETCHICGEMVNMGYLSVQHWLVNGHVDIPYIALHYMEHGSFSYFGTVNHGRIFPVTLMNMLTVATRVDGGEASLPAKVELKAGYPNPFNSTVNIPLSVNTQVPLKVRVQVVSTNGRCVNHLLDARIKGDHILKWDGTDDRGRPVASGLYIISCRLGEKVERQTVTLLK